MVVWKFFSNKKIKSLSGTTLAEIIIAVALISLFMTLVANMVTRYSKIINHQKQKELNFANFQMVMLNVTSEIQEAHCILSHSSNGEVLDNIVIERYNPENKDAVKENDKIKVHYYSKDDNLYRQVTHGSKHATYPIAYNLMGFKVTRENIRFYIVSAKFSDSSNTYVLSGKTYLKANI